MKLTDALANHVQVGDTVVYIVSGYQNSAALKPGVVVKKNPKTFRVLPLYGIEYIEPNDLMSYMERYVHKLPDGRYLRLGAELIVKPSRLLVVDGYDWPEYQTVLNLGIVPEPLDSLV